MNSPSETWHCDTLEAIPQIEYLLGIPHGTALTIVFGAKILGQRVAIGLRWTDQLSDFVVGIHRTEPIVWIRKLMSTVEIIQHSAFFLQCAKDYHQLATTLMQSFISHFKVEVRDDDYFRAFNLLKRSKQKGTMKEWQYFIHGHHCGFINQKTSQHIEASIVCGLEFGAMDPYFFVKYILSTAKYHPLPLVINEPYKEGERILQTMLSIGKFKEIHSVSSGGREIIVNHDAPV